MKHIAEVVEAAIARFTAVLVSEAAPPTLGAMLIATEPANPIMGIVVDITNHSADPNRRPTPHGMTRAELAREMPHLSELIITELTIYAVGEKRAGQWRQGAPYQALPIHTLLHEAETTSCVTFLGGGMLSFEYLRLLMMENSPESDGALRAHLDWLCAITPDGSAMQGAAAELGKLLAKDYARLRHVLGGISR